MTIWKLGSLPKLSPTSTVDRTLARCQRGVAIFWYTAHATTTDQYPHKQLEWLKQLCSEVSVLYLLSTTVTPRASHQRRIDVCWPVLPRTSQTNSSVSSPCGHSNVPRLMCNSRKTCGACKDHCGDDGSMETVALPSLSILLGQTLTCFSDSYTCSISSTLTLSLTGGLSLTAKSFALHSSSHG